MNHTPGPWYRYGPLTEDESGVAGGVHVDVVGGELEGCQDPLSILDDLSVADADLIAAAPDLLAACRAIDEHCPCDPDINEAFYQAWTYMRAAIEKAEGK